MRAIAHLGPHGQMGNEGKLLCKNALDLQLFRLLTSIDVSPIVIAGRKTAESMPFTLAGRTQLYLTNNGNAKVLTGGWIPINEQGARKRNYQHTWLIGGAATFVALQDCIEEAYITRFADFDYSSCECDAYWLPESCFLFAEREIFKFGYITVTKYLKDYSANQVI